MVYRALADSTGRGAAALALDSSLFHRFACVRRTICRARLLFGMVRGQVAATLLTTAFASPSLSAESPG